MVAATEALPPSREVTGLCSDLDWFRIELPDPTGLRAVLDGERAALELLALPRRLGAELEPAVGLDRGLDQASAGFGGALGLLTALIARLVASVGARRRARGARRRIEQELQAVAAEVLQNLFGVCRDSRRPTCPAAASGRYWSRAGCE